MKYVRIFAIVCVLSLCFSCFCFADDVDSSLQDGESETNVIEPVSNGSVVYIDNSDVGNAVSSLADIISSGALSRDDTSLISALEPMQLMSVNVSNERISASDANGFKAVILGLIGDYETVITDYTYQNQSGYTTHSIDVSEDWTWIAACAVFLVVVFCGFRIVGGILCNR